MFSNDVLCVFPCVGQISGIAVKSNGPNPNSQSRQFYRFRRPGGVESAAFHMGFSWGKHEKPFITQFTRADNITHSHSQTRVGTDVRRVGQVWEGESVTVPMSAEGCLPTTKTERSRPAGGNLRLFGWGGVGGFSCMDEFDPTFGKDRW